VKPKWFMIERGRRWHYRLGDKILAYVAWNFNGWDAYICTGNKWPNHQRCVHYHSQTGSNTCWEARRAIEGELAS
jgi:hypothetical protein